jgi:fluoroacetyl-CoA thioesterase
MYPPMGTETGIVPGIEGRTERVVDETLVTRHVGGEGVLGSPHMILLMEQCCHASVESMIGAGNTTVGYEVCVKHLGPSVMGATIVVSSILKEVTGNKLLFEVSCQDSDRLVGTGTHKRAIVPARG